MTKLKEYKMFIDGSWVESESKKTFETLNPENNEAWAIVPEATAKDVDKAVNAAQRAFQANLFSGNFFVKDIASFSASSNLLF